MQGCIEVDSLDSTSKNCYPSVEPAVMLYSRVFVITRCSSKCEHEARSAKTMLVKVSPSKRTVRVEVSSSTMRGSSRWCSSKCEHKEMSREKEHVEVLSSTRMVLV